MCFSAAASFGAGFTLAAIGTLSVRKANHPSRLAFASIPLVFAAQQLTEGFLWLSLSTPLFAGLQQPSTFVFLFFAQVVWPVLVPFSILLLEKKKLNRNALRLLSVIGSIIALYLAWCLVTFKTGARIDGYHILYIQEYPEELKTAGGILYLIVTILPPFLSSVKWLWTIGFAILISYLITEIFYEDYIVSVWCFFAALISLAVILVMHGLQKKEAREKTGEPVASYKQT